MFKIGDYVSIKKASDGWAGPAKVLEIDGSDLLVRFPGRSYATSDVWFHTQRIEGLA